MNRQPAESSRHRAILATLVLVIAVSALIAMGNLMSRPITNDDVRRLAGLLDAERAYGWPLDWYWRSARFPGTPTLRWSFSRYSEPRLIANLAVWLAILVALSVAFLWLLRTSRARLVWRPRLATLFVLAVVAAVTTLANLSTDSQTAPSDVHRCGWPLIWCRQAVLSPMTGYREWEFGTAAFTGNLVIWLVMLAAVARTCEWVFRRHQPRLRWSLRTMLAVVTVIAALCAWYVYARQRADEQDALIAIVNAGRKGMGWSPDVLYIERWGPEWFDLVGAGRLRQKVVGAEFGEFSHIDEVDLFKRLARLPNLRYLDAAGVPLLPAAGSSIGDMRQLRTLAIHSTSDAADQVTTLAAVGRLTKLEHLSASAWLATAPTLEPLARLTGLKSLLLEIRDQTDSREGLAALGKLTRLKQLSLRAWQVRGADMAYLAGLSNLKSLSIESVDEPDEEPGEYGHEAALDRQRAVLAEFPALARLEALDLTLVPLANVDLGRLAACPRLRSLSLEETGVNDAGLASLAAVESLRELGLEENVVTVAAIESLARLKSLRALHLDVTYVMDGEYEGDDEWESVVLDDGEELDVFSSEFDRLCQALEAVRQANPGIVIDTDCDGFQKREFPDASQFKPEDDWQRSDGYRFFKRR